MVVKMWQHNRLLLYSFLTNYFQAFLSTGGSPETRAIRSPNRDYLTAGVLI